MSLHFIGLGLNDEKDISLRGLDLIKHCDVLYLERYTSKLNVPSMNLAKLYNKLVIVADRAMTEEDADTTILKDAANKEVGFLVIGDPLSATTHMDLWLRARKKGIKTSIVHNASVLTAVGATGLQLYKFGKTTSIPFPAPNFLPETCYDVIKANKSMGAHTLLLLDIRPDKDSYMSVCRAIEMLLRIEERRKERVFDKDTFCVGCARLGSEQQKIVSGTAKQVMNADFGEPLHCLIVPGKLHFAEEEALQMH